MDKLLLTLAVVAALATPSFATSGPGCLVVVNVAWNDALNLRSRPSAKASVVDVLVPGRHGIIHLDGECKPKRDPWGSRWCPVTHFGGDRTTKGWVKARYVRDSECP
jgi:hypothetical protein